MNELKNRVSSFLIAVTIAFRGGEAFLRISLSVASLQLSYKMTCDNYL